MLYRENPAKALKFQDFLKKFMKLTWQASTPPWMFPAQSILGVTASSYILLQVWWLMMLTEASCSNVASSPEI